MCILLHKHIAIELTKAPKQSAAGRDAMGHPWMGMGAIPEGWPPLEMGEGGRPGASRQTPTSEIPFQMSMEICAIDHSKAHSPLECE